jgi:hypothetical protein
VLHRDVVAPVLGAALVVDLHHVRVVEGGGALGLLPEARDDARIFGVFLPQDLKREISAEHAVAGEEDLGHPPGAKEARKDVAVAKGVAKHEPSYPPRFWRSSTTKTLSLGLPGCLLRYGTETRAPCTLRAFFLSLAALGRSSQNAPSRHSGE